MPEVGVKVFLKHPVYIYISVAGGDISTRGCCPKYNPSIFKILFYFSLMLGEFWNKLKRGELDGLNKIKWL